MGTKNYTIILEPVLSTSCLSSLKSSTSFSQIPRKEIIYFRAIKVYLYVYCVFLILNIDAMVLPLWLEIAKIFPDKGK